MELICSSTADKNNSDIKMKSLELLKMQSFVRIKQLYYL
jgi:hypothetical protein